MLREAPVPLITFEKDKHVIGSDALDVISMWSYLSFFLSLSFFFCAGFQSHDTFQVKLRLEMFTACNRHFIAVFAWL
jgi:hypothetical protein